jgi:hypothetical protein
MDWLPRADLMLDRIPSRAQRAVVPYLWLVVALVVTHAGFAVLAGSGGSGAVAVVERAAALWSDPVAYLALAVAWLATGCVVAAVIDGQPRRHQPYLVAVAVAPVVALARHLGVQLIARRPTRTIRAFGWPVRFAAAAAPWAMLAPLVAPAAAAACTGLAVALVLYAARTLRPALRWPRRRLAVALAGWHGGLAVTVIAATLGVPAFIASIGALAQLIATVFLASAIGAITSAPAASAAVVAAGVRLGRVDPALPTVGGR